MLIEVNFFDGRNERRTIKQIANSFEAETSKVTKWIHEIYDDMFELNSTKPELFQATGIQVDLFMTHYDKSCPLYASLPVLPREFESFQFPFIQLKSEPVSFG